MYHIVSDSQHGGDRVCAAVGSGEKPDAAQRSGLQGPRVQDESARRGQHPSQRGCRWHLHRVRKQQMYSR